MTNSFLERLVDAMTRAPARIIEAIAFMIVAGVFTIHVETRTPANTLIDGLVLAGLTVLALRYTGVSERIADRLGMGPRDRIQGTVRPSDFRLFTEVEVNGHPNIVWRRLSEIRLRDAHTARTDLYDVLINPKSVGNRGRDPVFHVMLYRHNDDHVWPTDIIFDQGRTQFNFGKVDKDIPPILINLRVGPVYQSYVRPNRTTQNPEPMAPPPAQDPYERLIQSIIGHGPRSAKEIGVMRRKIGKALHPDAAPPDERAERLEALKRANDRLDQFKM